MTAAAAAPLMPIGAAPQTLPRTLDALVERLGERIVGSLDGRWPPWSLPTLATQTPDGPRARVLALRGLDTSSWQLTFHVDARSDKVRELMREPRVSVVFWDPADAIEARLSGTATVHRGDRVALDAWSKVSRLRRMACSVDAAPGSALDAPHRFDALAATQDDAVARDRFAVIVIQVVHCDWLWLGGDDMRRASLRYSAGRWSGEWVAP